MPPKRTAECSLPIADCNRSSSPNPHAFVWCDEHFVARLNFERVIPGIDVSSGTNHAKLTRRMWVAHDLLLDVIVADFPPPGLRPSEKYALIATVTVDHRLRFSFERSAIGVERERQAAQ